MKTLKEIKNKKKKKGNTTMKKYIAILMAIACAAALLLTGCGQTNDPQPDPQPSGLTGSVATDGST